VWRIRERCGGNRKQIRIRIHETQINKFRLMICIVSLNEYGVSFAHLLILFLRPIQQFLSIPSRTELSGNIMVRRDHKRDFWFGVVFGVVLFMGRGECAPSTQQQSRGENCPEVKPMKDFDIFKVRTNIRFLRGRTCKFVWGCGCCNRS